MLNLLDPDMKNHQIKQSQHISKSKNITDQ